MAIRKIYALQPLAALLLSIPTLAQQRHQPDVDSVDLEELVIRDKRGGALQPTSIDKMPVNPMLLPVSTSTVDQKLLEKQSAQRLSDAIQNIPGIYLMGATGGYQEELAGRGFAYTSSNTFKNGVRFNNSILPEVSALERVEVLRGSAAILYGNVAAGGVVNLVTRKPRFGRGGEIGFRAGSYDLYKPYLDMYGAVANSQHVAFRVVTTYEKAASFRDEVKSNRFYIAPSFLIRAGNKTEILLEGDYLNDNRTPDFGTGAINYTIAEVPRNRFLGVSWGRYAVEQQSATATVTHRFNDQWSLRSTTGLQGFTSDLFANTRPNASGNMIKTDGTWVRGLQRTGVRERYGISSLDLTGRIRTGMVDHTVLVGADVDGYRTTTTAYNGVSKYDSVNIYDPYRYTLRNDIPNLKARTATTTPITRYGVYAQDLLSIGKNLHLLVGGRYTYQTTGSEVLTLANDSVSASEAKDGALTPRLGAVYQPLKNLSMFASYSTSFTLNTGVDVTGKALPPSYLKQWEAGVKSIVADGAISLTATAYRIINDNLAQISLADGNTNANIKELTGTVESKGGELDLSTASWNGFSLRAGYSYNDTRYVKSNTYVEGSRLRYNPVHTTNASLIYDFNPRSVAKGLSLGAGVYHAAGRYAGRSTRVQVANDAYQLIELPDYTLVDFFAGYTFREAVSLRLRVLNLMDVTSYQAHDDNSINPIAPRQFSATVSYRF